MMVALNFIGATIFLCGEYVKWRRLFVILMTERSKTKRDRRGRHDKGEELERVSGFIISHTHSFVK